ncbi:hypothetical protein L1887_43967 [Cichorium endivia]|nr:hypothetical protein L1887_43967 [Cichorium endivia]
MDLEACLERVDLRSESVPSNTHVDAADELLPTLLAAARLAREHDHARTRTPHGLACAHPLAQRLEQTDALAAERDRRGLAARDDERIALAQLLGSAHECAPDRLERVQRVETVDVRCVLAKRSLDRQHTHGDRAARRGSGGGGGGGGADRGGRAAVGDERGARGNTDSSHGVEEFCALIGSVGPALLLLLLAAFGWSSEELKRGALGCSQRAPRLSPSSHNPPSSSSRVGRLAAAVI